MSPCREIAGGRAFPRDRQQRLGGVDPSRPAPGPRPKVPVPGARPEPGAVVSCSPPHPPQEDPSPANSNPARPVRRRRASPEYDRCARRSVRRVGWDPHFRATDENRPRVTAKSTATSSCLPASKWESAGLSSIRQTDPTQGRHPVRCKRLVGPGLAGGVPRVALRRRGQRDPQHIIQHASPRSTTASWLSRNQPAHSSRPKSLVSPAEPSRRFPPRRALACVRGAARPTP
jgi:hypothetical protein